MKKVNAGYKLIEELNFSNHHYVLGHMPDAPAPYVTWESNETKDAFFRGHYFSDKESALVDLFRRAGKELHLESGNPLAIALLTKQDHEILQQEYREASQREFVCDLLKDLLSDEEEYPYDYEALVSDTDFMSEALKLYGEIEHSHENETFIGYLTDKLEEFPQHKQGIKKIPDFLKDPEPVQISPEQAQLLNDLLIHPCAEIPKLYGPFGDGFDFFFSLEDGFTASLEMFPSYDIQNPNQLSKTEPPHVIVRITDDLGNIAFHQMLSAKDLNQSLTGAHQLKDEKGNHFLTLKIEAKEALRRTGNQFIYKCTGGDEYYLKHNGEPCTIQRALSVKESDILINGLMWEAKFPDGDKLHVFDHELSTPTKITPEKIPLSQQINAAQEKTKAQEENTTLHQPER